MKKFLFTAIVLASAIVKADVQWQIPGETQGTSRIVAITIQSKTLMVSTSNHLEYDFPIATVSAAGLSLKEFMDLLKEYDAATDKTLFVNASRKGSFGISSIDSLVMMKK